MDLPLFNWIEILTCLVSILYAKQLFRTQLWVLTPYMIMIVIAELRGKYLAERKLYVDNVHVFNISTIIEFMAFYYMLYHHVKSETWKKIIAWTVPVYLVITAINQTVVQGFDNLHTYTLALGGIFVIIFIFVYFFEALSTTEPRILTREPMFWISVGLFFFYLGDTTYNLVQPYMVREHMQKEGMHLFRLINNNLIIFEYACFSIGIIICGNSNPSVSKQRSLP